MESELRRCYVVTTRTEPDRPLKIYLERQHARAYVQSFQLVSGSGDLIIRVANMQLTYNDQPVVQT